MVKKKPLPEWAQKSALPETDYYVMDCHPRTGDADITEDPDLPAEIDNWMGGSKLTRTPPNPLVFIIEADDEGTMPPFFDDAVPLMLNGMVDALRECGIDNLDTYPAIIRETGSGKDHVDYSAVNIVGTVRAADMVQSVAEEPGMVQDGLINVFFENLVLDDSALHGQLLFRLAESISAIIVHKSVRDHLLKKGFDRLDFVHPAEWSG